MLTRDGRLALLVGLALFAYYLLILGGHHYSIDGIVMFEAAKQLFFRHSLVLDPPVKWGSDVFPVNSFSLGFMLAYLPVLALWSPLFYWMPSLQATPYNPAVAHNRELYGNLPYLLCSWLNPLITAITGCLVFGLGRRLGLTPGWAVTAALVYGAASPAAAYARYDFAQPLAGLALTAAVWSLIGAADGRRLRSLAGAGGALGLALLTRPEFAVMIAWIVAWLIISSRASGCRAAALRVSAVAVPVTAAALIYLWLNRLRFGGWSRTGYEPLSTLFPVSPSGALEGALGLLLSPGRGLLVFFPLAWLALPGLRRLIKERHPAGALCAGLTVAALGLYASYHIWWGGWSWGPRFLVPLLPLLTLASTFWTFRGQQRGGSGRKILFVGLASLGFAIAWNGILFDFVLYHRWVQNVMGLPDTNAAHFRLAASPLVSGWRFLPTTSVDLFVVRLGHLAGRPGMIAGLLIASALLGCLVWSGRRIRDVLRDKGVEGSGKLR